jgi:hypothetical protein
MTRRRHALQASFLNAGQATNPRETGTPSPVARQLRMSVCAVVASPLLGALTACGDQAQHVSAWTACPRPSSHADIQRFRVRGGETCAHASRVLNYAAFGHEGGCGTNGCHYLGYTCGDRPGGLRSNSSGGSYFTYEDDFCTRDRSHFSLARDRRAERSSFSPKRWRTGGTSPWADHLFNVGLDLDRCFLRARDELLPVARRPGRRRRRDPTLGSCDRRATTAKLLVERLTTDLATALPDVQSGDIYQRWRRRAAIPLAGDGERRGGVGWAVAKEVKQAPSEVI